MPVDYESTQIQHQLGGESHCGGHNIGRDYGKSGQIQGLLRGECTEHRVYGKATAVM